MKIRLKRFLNKHKNRIFSLIAVMVFIPMFSFNAFAYTSYDHFPIDYGLFVNIDTNTGTWSSSTILPNENNNVYTLNHSVVNRITALSFVINNPYSFPIDTDIFDYYLVGSVFSGVVDINNFLFFPTYLAVVSNEHDNSNVNLPISDVNFYHNDSSNWKGFSYSCKLDFTDKVSIKRIYLDSRGTSGTLTLPSTLNFEMSVIALPKGLTNGDAQQAIVSAINNQTSTLGGKIDDTNDFINNGNSSTGGIVSNNNSAIDNLDEVVSEYHATEQQFFDDFTANQQAINSDIVGWSWGGLVNCANWVGETMTDYYNNMGDFRQYIIYPLMLGIVLFFLGRGGAIIGHLFRKPTQSTVNIESTSFKRGNTRYTTTTTSKKGGVFRK